MPNNENTVIFSKKELSNGTKTLQSNFGRIDDFCGLFTHGNNKRDQRKLLKACIPKVNDLCFDNLLRMVQDSIRQQDFIPEAAFVEEQEDEPTNIIVDAHAEQNLRLLQHAAFCVKTKLDHCPSSFHPNSSAWDLCVALHDALHDIDPGWGEDASNASMAIVGLCETVYLLNVKSRDDVILHALPSLVEGALQSKADLKRLYAIREALTLIDFESEESKPFASLLLRLVSIPSCLKATEGKRLVSYLIRIGLGKQIHRSIRAQIPGNKPSILKDYGDIYYQAWKDCLHDHEREVVELEIYQDLVYALVHAARSQLVNSLLCVLEPLHRHQNKSEVEGFIYSLYGPLIWRALSAANEHVRANAVQVLGHVFPLRAPTESSKTEKTNPLERAFAALESALQDESPLVRTQASAATAIVLTNFWDVIPPRDIRKLLNCLVVQHASDASSVAVRAGAVDAISQILETPSSHAILRELLPPLGNLIHDKAEKVRAAVVKLLQHIKRVPNIKYYKIVSVHHLMARLVEEPKANSSVAAALTELMVNSYAPESADVEQLVGRAQKFLTDYPRAAPTFYTNLRKFRAPSFVCQLVVGLYHCLSVAIEELESRHRANDMRRVEGKRSRTNKEDTIEPGDIDLALCGTLANVILVLWTSIKDDLDHSPEWSDFVASEVEAQSLIDMVTSFDRMGSVPTADDEEEEQQRSAICNQSSKLLLQCAALLPPTAIEGVVKNLPVDSDASKSPAYLALMSVWGFDIGRDLAVSIATAFGDYPDTVHTNARPNSKKRRSTDRQGIPPIRRMCPLDAIRVVGAILQGGDPSSSTGRDSLIECDSLFDELQKASDCALQILSGQVVSLKLPINQDKEFLLEACESFGRLILHREASLFIGHENPSLSATALLFLDWADNVVGVVNRSKAQKISLPFSDPDLSSIKVDPSFIASPQASRISVGTSEQATPCWDLLNVAETLVASCCILISEWLAVGGPGGDVFSIKACGWCKLAPSDNLLLPYCRLSIQLARQTGNTSLLKSIFDHYKEELDEAPTEIVRNTISCVISSGTKPETITSVVEEVLSAALPSLGEFHFDAASDTACCVHAVWPFENSAAKAAIAAILRSIKGSKELIVQLKNRITSVSEDRRVLFLLHFLGMLSRVGSKVRQDAAKAMLELDKDSLCERACEMRDEFIDQTDTTMG